MTESPNTGTLTPGAIYTQYGMVRIAIDEEYLVDITGSDRVKHHTNEVTELLEMPGSDGWIDRMVRVRRSLITELENSRNELSYLRNYTQELGEALRDEAERRDWCEEYDVFAREWDLPPLNREWEVTMTVTVKARDEDDAVETVRSNVSIDRWSTEDPEYSASEA